MPPGHIDLPVCSPPDPLFFLVNFRSIFLVLGAIFTSVGSIAMEAPHTPNRQFVCGRQERRRGYIANRINLKTEQTFENAVLFYIKMLY